MFGWSLKRIRMEGRLKAYVERAAELLPDEHVVDARMFLEHGEYGLAVEHVISWLSELEIQIGREFAEETLAWCSEFGIADENERTVLGLVKPA